MANERATASQGGHDLLGTIALYAGLIASICVVLALLFGALPLLREVRAVRSQGDLSETFDRIPAVLLSGHVRPLGRSSGGGLPALGYPPHASSA